MRQIVSGMVGGCVTVLMVLALMGQTIIQGGGGLASTSIVLTDQASCPSGTTEVTAARGRFLVGNPSGGTVGTTLGTALTDGADASYTPVGTNATSTVTPVGTNATSTVTPVGSVGTHGHTFTGSALATHQHTAPLSTNVSAAVILSNEFGLGAAITREADSADAGGSAAAFTGSLVSATSGGTPAGTLDSVSGGTFTGSSSTVAAQTFTGSSSTVGAQTFTGTANTTMRGAISPYLQLLVCKR